MFDCLRLCVWASACEACTYLPLGYDPIKQSLEILIFVSYQTRHGHQNRMDKTSLYFLGGSRLYSISYILQFIREQLRHKKRLHLGIYPIHLRFLLQQSIQATFTSQFTHGYIFPRWLLPVDDIDRSAVNAPSRR